MCKLEKGEVFSDIYSYAFFHYCNSDYAYLWARNIIPTVKVEPTVEAENLFPTFKFEKAYDLKFNKKWRFKIKVLESNLYNGNSV